MCTHQKLIYTKYSKRPMYVKCGHCKACLQEKASKRVQRIHDTGSDKSVCLMVALTYSRGTAPFVKRDEAYDFVRGLIPQLPVYRSCSIRKVRKPLNYDSYSQIYKRVDKECVLENIDFVQESSLFNTKDMKYENGKIGVIFYRDYQRFAARLRLNLKRHYKYEKRIFIYACSEFGVRSHRPHFHLLIFCDKSDEKILRSAIIESWPFSDLSRFPRAIERSFKAASYVASYVNQSSNFPVFFKDYFKPKHSYSKGFGLSNPNYSLSSILSRFERGTLKFSVAKLKNGIPSVVDVPIPSYVINRYFPKFKGFTTCPPCSLYAYMRRICSGDWETQILDDNPDHLIPHNVYCLNHDHLFLGHDDLRKIHIRLHNAYRRFCECVPDGYDKTFEGYLNLHIRVWNTYNSTILRLHLENVDVPLWEKYDNLDELNNNTRMRAVLGLYDKHFEVTDPNEFVSNKLNSYRYETSFDDHIKHKNVSNAIYSLDEDCEL